MKIVLTEILTEPGPVQGRREFQHPAIVLVGRDSQQCHVAFDAVEWPMVSRLHAELRIESDRCLLSDKNSKQGTYLNEQQVSSTVSVKSGDRIRFGRGGPQLEVEIELSQTLDTPSTLLQSLPDTEPHNLPALVFEKGIPAERGSQLVLKPEGTLLGRDPAADLVLDVGAMGVSRRHAEIRVNAHGRFQIADLNTINGTLVNGHVIAQPTVLQNGDRIQLSPAGPLFRFVDPSGPSPVAERANAVTIPPTEVIITPKTSSAAEALATGLNTLVYRKGISQPPQVQTAVKPSGAPLLHCTFDDKEKLTIGRSSDNDLKLDGLLISKNHARFVRTARALLIEDSGSTNGVYVNGTRISGRQAVTSEDVIQIGPFVLRADPIIGVSVFDTRSETRIDALNITDVVSIPRGGSIKLLDDISLSIQPNEFVGLLGPSGAGKSTFMNALNGVRQTSDGVVLMNSLDLYQHLQSLKQSIGYVPQDDIIHRELTCYDTLYYVARLRLSRDVRKEEIDQIITEVLDVTGLTERRNTKVSQLSGGQRKRVSIAVELITRPSVIFLDEPTSGLDPATEERIMKLFRQIAESGRTVILTTHAMENVHLFDKIVLLMQGKLIFYGRPAEALEFAGARNFIELYNKLEGTFADVRSSTADLQKSGNIQSDKTSAAEHWRQRFVQTKIYERNVATPLGLVQQESKVRATVQTSRRTVASWRQWSTLIARYARLLSSDKLNLLILLGQAPIIAVMTCMVVGKFDSRDFPFFILALIPLWFGTSVAAREIVKERSVYKRERMVNLALLPYLGSKLFTLSCIVALQCILLFATLKVFHFANLVYLPGTFGGAGQWATMVLTGTVGIAMGLFVSALVRTSEMATSIVPLLLIPQILFCGLVGVPSGVTRYAGALMPATWSFDEMKRLSRLDTLKAEGSDADGPNKGAGLYKHVKESNLESVRQTRTALEDYTRRSNESLVEYDRRIKTLIARNDVAILAGQQPASIGTPPAIPDPETLKEDLSDFVTFKHPWGGLVLNVAVLFVMYFVLLIATLIVLRIQDPRAHKS